jgi:hypothetical protein
MTRRSRIASGRFGGALALTAVTVLGTVTMAPAAVAAPAAASAAVGGTSAQPTEQTITPMAALSCYAVGLLQTCWTGEIQAPVGCHCVYASVTNNGFGDVFDARNGKHVGPTRFNGIIKISGLFSQYHLRVTNVLGPAALGILSDASLP